MVAHVTTTDISLDLLLREQLEAFSESGLDVVTLSAPGPFAQRVEEAGIRHIPMHHATRSSSLWSDLKSALEFWQVVRRLRPDIVHTHNPKPGVYGRIVAGLAGVPVVINTVHGLYATPDDSHLRRFAVYAVERLAAAFSDAELVQNPEDLLTLRRLGVPARRLHLLGNGINLDRFSPARVSQEQRVRMRSELGAKANSVVISTVGRLVAEKGLRELFAAAKRVRAADQNTLFVVTGPSDISKSDAITPEELQQAQQDGILILGHRDDIESIYGASDVFVLASHREGFPRSAMEAAAMGLPIVATAIRGCRQVVEDGATGLLVPARDPDALAGAILSLANDPLMREKMGARATLKARSEFNQQSVIRLTVEVYETLIARRRSSRTP